MSSNTTKQPRSYHQKLCVMLFSVNKMSKFEIDKQQQQTSILFVMLPYIFPFRPQKLISRCLNFSSSPSLLSAVILIISNALKDFDVFSSICCGDLSLYFYTSKFAIRDGQMMKKYSKLMSSCENALHLLAHSNSVY